MARVAGKRAASTGAGHDQVVAVSTADGVDTGTAIQVVSPCAAGEAVVATAPVHRPGQAAGRHVEHVVALVTRQFRPVAADPCAHRGRAARAIGAVEVDRQEQALAGRHAAGQLQVVAGLQGDALACLHHAAGPHHHMFTGGAAVAGGQAHMASAADHAAHGQGLHHFGQLHAGVAAGVDETGRAVRAVDLDIVVVAADAAAGRQAELVAEHIGLRIGKVVEQIADLHRQRHVAAVRAHLVHIQVAHRLGQVDAAVGLGLQHAGGGPGRIDLDGIGCRADAGAGRQQQVDAADVAGGVGTDLADGAGRGAERHVAVGGLHLGQVDAAAGAGDLHRALVGIHRPRQGDVLPRQHADGIAGPHHVAGVQRQAHAGHAVGDVGNGALHSTHLDIGACDHVVELHRTGGAGEERRAALCPHRRWRHQLLTGTQVRDVACLRNARQGQVAPCGGQQIAACREHVAGVEVDPGVDIAGQHARQVERRGDGDVTTGDQVVGLHRRIQALHLQTAGARLHRAGQDDVAVGAHQSVGPGDPGVALEQVHARSRRVGHHLQVGGGSQLAQAGGRRKRLVAGAEVADRELDQRAAGLVRAEVAGPGRGAEVSTL